MTSMNNLWAALVQVFPTFRPVMEQAWVEGWHPPILWPESGEVQWHRVFQAESHDGDHPSLSTVVVSQSDPEQARIEVTVSLTLGYDGSKSRAIPMKMVPRPRRISTPPFWA